MYSELKEIEELAEKVLEENQEDLQDCYGQPVRIKYLVKDSKKSQFLGKCCKTSGPWKFLTDFDFVIIIWGQWWNSAHENEKKALLFHELKHIKMDEKEDEEGNIEICWKLKKHFAEVFSEEI